MEPPHSDLQHMIRGFIGAEEITDSLTIMFNDVAIRVKTNSVPLAIELRAYYREFIGHETATAVEVHAFQCEPPGLPLIFREKEPDPGKTRVKEEFVDFPGGRIVRKRLTGMVFFFEGPYNLAMGPCLENVNQVVNFINNRFMQVMLNSGCLLFHASGVTVDGSGIALCGYAGAGKSSLSLHLMSSGARFVSNDRILARREDGGIVMYGVAKYPRINPGTILSIKEIENIITEEARLRYNGMPAEQLWTLEEKHDLYIDDVYGKGNFITKAPMKTLVVLNWSRKGADTRISEISLQGRADLFPSFMKSPGLFYIPENGARLDLSENAYLDLLGQCRVIEVTGGVNFKAVVDYCHDAIGE